VASPTASADVEPVGQASDKVSLARTAGADQQDVALLDRHVDQVGRTGRGIGANNQSTPPLDFRQPPEVVADGGELALGGVLADDVRSRCSTIYLGLGIDRRRSAQVGCGSSRPSDAR
jgi:hypothetical protein